MIVHLSIFRWHVVKREKAITGISGFVFHPKNGRFLTINWFCCWNPITEKRFGGAWVFRPSCQKNKLRQNMLTDHWKFILFCFCFCFILFVIFLSLLLFPPHLALKPSFLFWFFLEGLFVIFSMFFVWFLFWEEGNPVSPPPETGHFCWFFSISLCFFQVFFFFFSFSISLSLSISRSLFFSLSIYLSMFVSPCFFLYILFFLPCFLGFLWWKEQIKLMVVSCFFVVQIPVYHVVVYFKLCFLFHI